MKLNNLESIIYLINTKNLICIIDKTSIKNKIQLMNLLLNLRYILIFKVINFILFLILIITIMINR